MISQHWSCSRSDCGEAYIITCLGATAHHAVLVCKGGTSVNVLPPSRIAVGTYGPAGLSCPDTAEQLNSQCWVSEMPRSSKPPPYRPPGAIREGSGDSSVDCVCFSVCVGGSRSGLEHSVGARELIFSQRAEVLNVPERQQEIKHDGKVSSAPTIKLNFPCV